MGPAGPSCDDRGDPPCRSGSGPMRGGVCVPANAGAGRMAHGNARLFPVFRGGKGSAPLIMVVFMLSVRVFSCMCPDCVACIVFAGFCFLGCLFLFSFVCSVGFGRSVRLVLCLFVLLSVRLVLLVLVVLSGLYCVCAFFCLSGLFCWFWSFCPACIASLDWLCAAFGSVWSVCPRWCPACASLLFRLVVSSCFPCCAVLSCFPFRPCLFPVFFFSASPFCLRRLAPCGRRAPRAARGPSLFPLSSLIVVRVPGGG